MDNLLFQKSLGPKRAWRVMDGSTPDPTRQQTLCQIMEAGKRAPHTQTPPRSATGQVPAFHLAALPRVRRWSCWSCLYGVWVPGSCPAVSLAPVDPVEGKSVGKHDWVIRFLRGAAKNKSFTPPSIPSWDLSLVLTALQQGLFEPLQTVEPKFLSMKTLLLLALASIKRVGDLHTFSVG